MILRTGMAFLLLVSFVFCFFFLFRFRLFFFLECGCLLCAICDTWLRAWVYHPEPPHAQSLFLFPIVFGINLIHFFDGKNNRTGQNLIICLGFSITRRAARAIQERVGTKGEFLGNGKCEFQRHNGETRSVKGETKSAIFWQGKV